LGFIAARVFLAGSEGCFPTIFNDLRKEKMNSKFAMKTFAVVALIGGLGVGGVAGDIDAKLREMRGVGWFTSTRCGKTFPVPKEHPVWIKGLLFARTSGRTQGNNR